MRVLVCGDREWRDRALTRALIKGLKEKHGDDLVIIEGECRGADRIAREEAMGLDIVVDKYPADWEQYGPSAGPIRNEQMLRDGKPDLAFVCHNDLAHSKGTKDMVRRLKARKIKAILICSDMLEPEEL